MALLSRTIETSRDLYLHKLGAALKMEQTILELLPELEEKANDAQLKAALNQHYGQTQTHVSNIEKAFEALGAEPDDSPCPAIEGLEKEGQSNLNGRRFLLAAEPRTGAGDAPDRETAEQAVGSAGRGLNDDSRGRRPFEASPQPQLSRTSTTSRAGSSSSVTRNGARSRTPAAQFSTASKSPVRTTSRTVEAPVSEPLIRRGPL
jgi:Domain of unknown function (DUF892)